MPFYLRKSIKFGPLRLNLSKSGVGVSAGIKGLRFGTGPRGNYVHAGRGGIYYRKTLSNRDTRPSNKAAPLAKPEKQNSSSNHRDPDIENYQELESDSALQMVDSDSSDLLSELNDKQKRVRFWPTVAIGSAATVIFGFVSASPAALLVGIVGLAVTPIVILWDRRRRTTVLFYDLEEDYETAFGNVYAAIEAVKSCNKLWHLSGIGDIKDPKYSAGATQAVSRKKISLGDSPPKIIRTNVPVPTFPAGKQSLCFFPDRLLIFEKNAVGAVSYQQLQLSMGSSNFVEEDRVPKDAKVVDRTWRYVNKRGGPDKRFKDNKELPVVLYDEMALTSSSGLNEHFQLSKLGVANQLSKAISRLKEV